MKNESPSRGSGQWVVPGSFLGVIEEFTAGSGTYVDKGKIFAKVSGRTLLDMQNRTVSIFPAKKGVKVPQVGSYVVGQVSKLQSKTAIIRILKIGKDLLSGVFTGLVYISDASQSYVDSIYDVCKAGDIIRAKVISQTNRLNHLSMAERRLGVLYAFCSQCCHLLEQKRYKMQCANCGKVEKRKTAEDYGETNISDLGEEYESKGPAQKPERT
ncbi:MAG: exosome complex RNA-binding protein Csl4 [Candidatus Bathyarchaeota archaeon]|nr:MAG: exosome complex RNA-binding protein Csl4 [Candidatus Bathyarchaeota archaeon]